MSERELQVKEILKTILPAMEADGGGIESYFVKENDIYVKFKGTCLVCPSINLTIKFGLEDSFKKKLNWVDSVYKI